MRVESRPSRSATALLRRPAGRAPRQGMPVLQPCPPPHQLRGASRNNWRITTPSSGGVRAESAALCVLLAYAALLGGTEALPLLERYRQIRMRYIWDTRGAEQEKLDWIARSLRGGRSIESYDAAPKKISFK